MMKKIWVVLLLIILLANPADLSSCGPFFPTAIFTGKYAPDDEREFYSGKLGIVQHTYARRYLAMAYRTLAGKPLTPPQVDAITNLEERYRVTDVDGAVKQWLAARQHVPGATSIASIDIYSRNNNYFVQIPRCGADAFLTAKNTLAEYIRRYKASGRETKNWLDAQDEVFGGCAGDTTRQIPEEAPTGSSEFVASDRQYQIAAAEFYSDDYVAARAKWSKIASDANSRWQVWAPYLIARSYLREDKYDEAARQLKQMLADPIEAPLHRQAQLLLDRAMAKLDPGAQLTVLSRRLMEPNPAELGHDLNDYTFLYDQLSTSFAGDYQARMDKLREAVTQADLSTWVAEYSNSPTLKNDAQERWQKTNSLAWLLAAGALPETETALRAVPDTSPAYATARLNLASALITDNKPSEAGAALDEAMRHSFDISSMNAFHALRMQVAESFDVFLANAPRQVAKIGQVDVPPEDPDGTQYLFDEDGAWAFNETLPLSLWLRAAGTQALAQNLRANIAQAGWIRAVILGKDEQPFATILAAVKPSYASDVKGFQKLTGPERSFAEVFWILHHPELGISVRADLPRIEKDGTIDNYRDNWWYTSSPAVSESVGGRRLMAVGFLSKEEQTDLKSQTEALKAAGAGPDYLAKQALDWATTHPQDPRNPEALALAVKTSRFSGATTTDNVERAFRLLHTRYPNSEWAKKTPYWFK